MTLNTGHVRPRSDVGPGRAAAGKRRVPGPAAFLANLETETLCLERELRTETWRPGEADAAAAGAKTNSKKLTFMLEVPAESVTYVRLGGRCRTWFCGACVEEMCRTEAVEPGPG